MNVPQIQNDGQYGQYGEANYQAFLADQEEGEEYEPTTNYLRGGKRKSRSKGRKTRKNKRKRTRKLKRGKRKQTKHRKSRPTKKH
jgi:hypothetical protein